MAHSTHPSIAVALTGLKTIGFIDETAEDRPLQPQEVRVQTLYSGLSAGTELTYYRGSNPYLSRQWDPDRRIFLMQAETAAGTTYPLRTWGYEEAGIITERGQAVEDLPEGTYVFGTWGHRSGAILQADYARSRRLPAGLDPIQGIFSHLGAITLNGILDSAIRLGETVAVFGLGVIGNLVGQLARLSGARVIGVDLIPQRLELARQVGFDHVIDGRAEAAAERIKELTGGRGADICIEASGVIPALQEAIRACAYSSRVVAMGFYQGGAAGLSLGDEFHHNRIDLVCSQISGVNPALQHRWDRARLIETFMNLLAQDRLQTRPFLTHIRPAWEAPQLYRIMDTQPDQVMLAVLDFQVAPPTDLEITPLASVT